MALALARLGIELGDNLLGYDAIISDDTAGRLPSLFVQKLANKKRQAVGKKGILTHFISGGYHGDLNQEAEEKIKEFLKKNKEKLKKIILVTEIIMSGRSISRLAKVIEDFGIDLDIAAVSVSELPEILAEDSSLSPKISKHVYYGELSRIGDEFHEKYTGVRKDLAAESAHPVLNKGGNQKNLEYENQTIKQDREAITALANEVWHSVLSDEAKKKAMVLEKESHK